MTVINIIKTKIGLIKIVSYKNYIYSVEFLDNNNTQPIIVNNDLALDINNYFKSKTTEFLSKYKLVGTPFEKKVWDEIIKIPYGKTKTYGDIAKAIGQPNAYRAVANACGKNKIALIVPCHRVIGKTNKGGYKWGTDKKEWLLDFEKQNS